MAGWINFAGTVGKTGNIMSKTVTESLMPAAIQVAAAQELTDPKRLTSAIVSIVMHCKKVEFAMLADNDDKVDAVMAGEFWANSAFHHQILRFEHQRDAWRWVMKHMATREMIMSPAVREKLIQKLGMNANDEITMSITNIVLRAYYLVEAAQDPNLAMQGLVNYVCGLAKMGTAARTWIRSKLGQLKKECDDPDLELRSVVLESVWDYYGRAHAPTDLQWPGLFQFLQGQCQGSSLIRLATTCQFASGHGAAVTTMVHDAMTEAKDFDWSMFAGEGGNTYVKRIRAEIETWTEDYNALLANPWKMFVPAAQGVSQKIINLGYLSKQLLIAKGVNSVSDYQGLDNADKTVIPLKGWINSLITKYKEEIATADAAAVPDRVTGEALNPNEINTTIDPAVRVPNAPVVAINPVNIADDVDLVADMAPPAAAPVE